MKKRLNNKGFTLIELLATVALLAILLSITMYISLDVIKSSREKSYQVTINNLEKNANTYVIENSDKLFYITDGSVEYQCVTIRDLVELGYLDVSVNNAKVAEDETVDMDDYIYIERDNTTKALLKSVYDKDNEYGCNNAINTVADIVFTFNPDYDKWSRSKEVTITYKLKNKNNASNYTYKYTLGNGSENTTSEMVVTKTIEEKMVINAKILDDDNVLANKSINVTKIDRIGPAIALGDGYQPGSYFNTVTIPLSITDTESGVNYRTIDKEDFEVSIDGEDAQSFELLKNNNNYSIKINDSIHSGNVTIKVSANKIFDNVENGNSEITLPTNINMEKKYIITLVYEGSDYSEVNIGTIEVTNGQSASIANHNLPPYGQCTYYFTGWYAKISSVYHTLINNTGYVYTISGYTDESGNWSLTENKKLYAKYEADCSTPPVTTTTTTTTTTTQPYIPYSTTRATTQPSLPASTTKATTTTTQTSPACTPGATAIGDCIADGSGDAWIVQYRSDCTTYRVGRQQDPRCTVSTTTTTTTTTATKTCTCTHTSCSVGIKESTFNEIEFDTLTACHNNCVYECTTKTNSNKYYCRRPVCLELYQNNTWYCYTYQESGPYNATRNDLLPSCTRPSNQYSSCSGIGVGYYVNTSSCTLS